MQVADPVRDVFDVKLLRDSVARVHVEPLDRCGARISIVKADVHGIDRVRSLNGRHRVAVALIDRGLRGPEGRNRLAALSHVRVCLRGELPDETLATILWQGPDG